MNKMRKLLKNCSVYVGRKFVALCSKNKEIDYGVDFYRCESRGSSLLLLFTVKDATVVTAWSSVVTWAARPLVEMHSLTSVQTALSSSAAFDQLASMVRVRRARARGTWAVLAVLWCCCWSARTSSAGPAKQGVGTAAAAMAAASSALAPGVPASPCPGVFRFERRGHGWQGVITVPAPPTGMPLVLRVDIAIAAALTTKYAGTLQLQEGRKALLGRLAAGDRRPVRYTLRFPPGMPLPSVTRIHATGKALCRGKGGGGREPGVLTTISLEHSVRPERVPPESSPTTPAPRPSVQLFQQTENAEPVEPAEPAEPLPGGEESVDEDQVCGRPVHHRLLVAGGEASSPGDWPWLAAVFASTALGLEFHCAGSLVSASHVLTAAHCVHRHKPEALLVYLGRHNVRKWTEPQAQAREVAVVHVHPDHQAGNYTADLAVLELAERAVLDWFVRPVCLDWAGPDALGAVVGRVGTVVGWGTNVPVAGHALSAEPRAARLPIVSQETCLRSRPEFLHVTSERTFCAGFRNGTGPCNGDSGSGLVLPSDAVPAWPGTAAPWYLRGVVSLSLMDGDRRTCDLSHFVVFTDVAKFRGWLAGILRPRRAVRPPISAGPSTKQVETQTDLGDQPIWDSDPDPLPS